MHKKITKSNCYKKYNHRNCKCQNINNYYSFHIKTLLKLNLKGEISFKFNSIIIRNNRKILINSQGCKKYNYCLNLSLFYKVCKKMGKTCIRKHYLLCYKQITLQHILDNS